jgi:GAF domain-containing protein
MKDDLSWPLDEALPLSCRALGLVDAPPPPAFDGLTRAAAVLFATPVALISVIDDKHDRQVFASQRGLPEPWASLSQTPLSHSFCKMVRQDDAPLRVNDARKDPRVRDNGAVADLGVIAYLGVPVHGPDGTALGALCVIDHCPRGWCDQDVALLQDLARCVSDEILLRAYIVQRERLFTDLRRAHDRLDRYGKLKEAVSMAVLAPGLSREERLCELLRTCRRLFGYSWAGLAEVDGDGARLWCSDGPGVSSRPGDWVTQPRMRAQEVIDRGEILGPPDSKTSGQSDVRGNFLQDYLGVPVVVQGQPFGVIEMTGPQRRPCHLSHDELTVLGIAGMVAGVLLELGGAEGDKPAPFAAASFGARAHSEPLTGFHEPEVEQLAGMPLERRGVVPTKGADLEG